MPFFCHPDYSMMPSCRRMNPIRKTRAVREAPTNDGQNQNKPSKRNKCKP